LLERAVYKRLREQSRQSTPNCVTVYPQLCGKSLVNSVRQAWHQGVSLAGWLDVQHQSPIKTAVQCPKVQWVQIYLSRPPWLQIHRGALSRLSKAKSRYPPLQALTPLACHLKPLGREHRAASSSIKQHYREALSSSSAHGIDCSGVALVHAVPMLLNAPHPVPARCHCILLHGKVTVYAAPRTCGACAGKRQAPWRLCLQEARTLAPVLASKTAPAQAPDSKGCLARSPPRRPLGAFPAWLRKAFSEKPSPRGLLREARQHRFSERPSPCRGMSLSLPCSSIP
jgi:hypothetical protein